MIQLIQERSDIQGQSSLEMKEKRSHDNLELEGVIIGAPLRGQTSERARTA